MADTSTELRVGIVGCGRIAGEFEDVAAEHPASIAGAFAEIPETRIVAATSRGRERLERFGRRWGVTALYHDYREMLAAEALDIVAVATHPPLHAEIVDAACSAGVRGIFCEKPIALDLPDSDLIVRRVEESGAKLVVNCTRRYSGLYESVRRIVEDKSLGDLVHIVGHSQGVKPTPEWVADTEGPLLHDAVHLFDIMRFFAGDAESVIATAHNPTKRFRVEDTSQSILQFAGGVEGIAVVDEMAEYSDFSVELNFTGGRVRLGSFCQGLWESTPNPGGEDFSWQHLEPRPLPEPAWPGTPVLGTAGNLVGAVLRDEPIRCDARDGRAAVEIIMAIYQSQLAEGSRVALPVAAGPSPLEALREAGML